MKYLGLPKCVECGTTDIDHDSRLVLCQACYDEQYEDCVLCLDSVEREETVDGYCPDCYEFRKDEEDEAS